jgi:uncharacterized protein YrrD
LNYLNTRISLYTTEVLILKHQQFSKRRFIMLRSIKSLEGYKIQATDGALGKVNEFYFDDETWTIRYLVVDTGTWLSGRKVLISPLCTMDTPDWKLQRFPVNLTKDQVKESPDIDVDKPVSRQHQIDLHKYYGWPVYWPLVTPTGVPLVTPLPSQIEKEKAAATEEKGDPHLRSTEEVTGYTIHATDGEIGHVKDFIADDKSWVIRYMVVDTGHWLPGRKVLIAPAWITKISWSDDRVNVDLSRESVKDSPRYDPSAPINQEYEIQLYDFYGRPKYW